MYQLIMNPFTNTVAAVCKTDVQLFIPVEPANTDYQAFLKYQAEGGKVYAADEEVPADEGNT